MRRTLVVICQSVVFSKDGVVSLEVVVQLGGKLGLGVVFIAGFEESQLARAKRDILADGVATYS